MLSEQERQRRRERKRLEREEKRESARTSVASTVEFVGDISENLFDYAGPLVKPLADGRHLAELRARLRFAAVVWNAVIDAEGDPIDAFTELVLDMAAKVPGVPPALAILTLARRKADQFRDDVRLVVSVDVHRRDGQLCVVASSAAPLPRSPPSVSAIRNELDG